MSTALDYSAMLRRAKAAKKSTAAAKTTGDVSSSDNPQVDSKPPSGFQKRNANPNSLVDSYLVSPEGLERAFYVPDFVTSQEESFCLSMVRFPHITSIAHRIWLTKASFESRFTLAKTLRPNRPQNGFNSVIDVSRSMVAPLTLKALFNDLYLLGLMIFSATRHSPSLLRRPHSTKAKPLQNPTTCFSMSILEVWALRRTMMGPYIVRGYWF